MKCLLINSMYSKGNAPSWIPLGLLILASYVRSKGIEVKIYDNLLSSVSPRLDKFIDDYKPDLVGIGGMTVQSMDGLKIGMLARKKNPNIKIVYGGVHFTFLPSEGLKYGDLIVQGEGEQTLLEICKGINYREIKGICFKKDRTIERNPARDFIADLDTLPIPAYDLINLDNYHDCLITGEKAITMLTGRGCPYNCYFCASPQIYKRKVRYHSIKYVLDHIGYIYRNYNLRNLRIMDDTFTINKNRVFEFCDGLAKNNLRLNINCLSNIRESDYQMFKRMKEAGFSTITFGVESGNENILKLINKDITKQEVRLAVSQARQAGLGIELLFMVGNIGETKSTILESIEFAKELNTNYYWFQYAIPFPGSKFFEKAKDYGKIHTRDYNDYHHQSPAFIPRDLALKDMKLLREKAMRQLMGIELEVGPIGKINLLAKGLIRKYLLSNIVTSLKGMRLIIIYLMQPRKERVKIISKITGSGERLLMELFMPKWHWIYKGHTARYNWVEKYTKGKEVLDSGCGTGYGTYYLAKKAKKIIGIDIDRDAINYAQKRYYAKNLLFKCEDTCSTSFIPDLFDVIVSFEVIEHVEDLKIYLSEIKRLLKPEGICIISTPNDAESAKYNINPNVFHKRTFIHSELKDLLEGSFKEVKIFGQDWRNLKAKERTLQNIKKIKLIKPENGKRPVLSCLTDHKRFMSRISDFQMESENLENSFGFIAICKKQLSGYERENRIS